MKNNFVKFLSACLALSLVFSVPLTAFAAEVEPTAVGVCTHSRTTTYTDVATFIVDEQQHFTEKYKCYVCDKCGMSWRELQESGFGFHSFDATGTCFCGYSK